MSNENFKKALLTQKGNESSILRSTLATIILRNNNVSTATEKALREIVTFAKKNQAESATIQIFESSTSDIFTAVSNAIFYNSNSITRNPNKVNTPSKSPKGVADAVIQAVSDMVAEGK